MQAAHLAYHRVFLYFSVWISHTHIYDHTSDTYHSYYICDDTLHKPWNVLMNIHAFWLPLREATHEREMSQRLRTKVGRNEPCPCGSGKKFKKCCGFASELH